MTDLTTPESRAKLKPKPDPYTWRIAPYRHLTFYRGERANSWGAKMQPPGGKRQTTKLGDESDYTFAEALNKAVAWCDSGGNTTAVSTSKLTLRIACSRYLTWRHDEKSTEDYISTKGLFDTHVFNHPMADRLVATLQTPDYQAWLAQTGEKLVRCNRDPDPDERRRKGRYTANLTWQFICAALNRATKTNRDLPAGEWKAVDKLPGGRTRARAVWLTQADVTRLTNSIDDPDFLDLVLAGVATGARKGELAATQVRDLDLENGRWTIRSSKVAKNVGTVRVLTDQTVELFKRRCSGLAPTDLVFTWQGAPWKKQHERFLKAAIKRAKLDPATVFYSLRHAYVSQQMKAGVSPLVIAQNVGTSIKQIEDHYGHFADEHKREELAKGAFDIELPESNVVGIR